MLSIYKHEVQGCRLSGFLLSWEGGQTAVVMRRLWSLVPPLRDGSLGFCMHGIAGTLKAKIKKASIVRQQKSSGNCFSGSSANRLFLAFFHDMKLNIAYFVEDTVFFWNIFLAECPFLKCQQSCPCETLSFSFLVGALKLHNLLVTTAVCPLSQPKRKLMMRDFCSKNLVFS